MAKKKNIIGGHLHPVTASNIVGTSSWGENAGVGLTAAGTTLATALQLSSDVNHVGTVAASSGVNLDTVPDLGDRCLVYNASGTTLNIYPGVAAGTINGGTAGAAVTLATLKAAEFVCTSSTPNWAYVLTS